MFMRAMNASECLTEKQGWTQPHLRVGIIESLEILVCMKMTRNRHTSKISHFPQFEKNTIHHSIRPTNSHKYLNYAQFRKNDLSQH